VLYISECSVHLEHPLEQQKLRDIKLLAWDHPASQVLS
jgi:hypothetical protein